MKLGMNNRNEHVDKRWSPGEKRCYKQRAFKAEKWILGGSVWFLWLSTWTQDTKGKRVKKKFTSRKAFKAKKKGLFNPV